MSFFDDAKKAAHFLGIALTKRGKINGEPIPLCGVPVHALDNYLHKLIKGGFKVAICDQLEEAKPGTVVRRGVTRVLTPGTLTEAALLDDKSSSYLLSFFPMADSYALLFGELLTAQLFATVLPVSAEQQIESELVRFFPAEILIPQSASAKKFETHFKKMGYFVSPLNYESAREQEQEALSNWTKQQFKPDVLQLLQTQPSLASALFYFYAYVRRNYESALHTFKTLQIYQPEDFLLLDRMTLHNLELVSNTQDGGRNNTLLASLDGSLTAMGARLIKKWLVRPLVNKDAIMQRQDVIGMFIQEIMLRKKLMALLAGMGDLERIIGRILLDRAPVQDYIALCPALQWMPTLKKLLRPHIDLVLIALIDKHIDDFTGIVTLLSNALHTEPHKNWIIKKGYDPSLDHLRNLVENGHQEIATLEQQEQVRTGITHLKIRYNAIHGYYIEVTKTGMHLVPADYKRIQTLIGRERFTTPHLQQLYYDIERARTEINHVEQALFIHIKRELCAYAVSLRKLGHALSHIDALLGLAIVATNNGYVRPQLNDQRTIVIKGGRHPVIETECKGRFIPNDTQLDDAQLLWIITGPNMGGKSTYLRQVALNCIMAHMGSFVAADSADIALLDRIFTRIGAGDNLAAGKSTFLVEMEETALICRQATRHSLVILDEVGRGTSTFDGLAIAQAVVEYLVQLVGARCLFATHYHELTLLEKTFTGIVNYYAASSKSEQGIIFLYKIIRGIADGSFGIEVAKLAQLPLTITNRASVLVHQLSVADRALSTDKPLNGMATFLIPSVSDKTALASTGMGPAVETELLALINGIDYNHLSPKKALDLIWELKEVIDARRLV